MPPAPGCPAAARSRGRAARTARARSVPPSVDAKQRGVLDARVDGVGIGQRRLEMPDALELPGMRRAVVPLVRAGDAVVDELVADRLPRLAAVVRALDQLAEPAAGLRRVQPVRVGRRSFEVVDLPAGKVRAADIPLAALAVGRQDERALACAHQYPYPIHSLLLPCLTVLSIGAGQDRQARQKNQEAFAFPYMYPRRTISQVAGTLMVWR